MTVLIVKPERTPVMATRCSMFDEQLRWLAPRGGFCYPTRLDPQRLARALAQVLPDYQAFAGRLRHRRDGWYIEPSALGVPLEVVESSKSIHALADETNATRGSGAAADLSALRALRGKGPLFSARLTLTPDGSILGFAWHHIAGDYYSALLMLGAWALAYRGLPHPQGFDVPDRHAYLLENLPDPPEARSSLEVMSPRTMFRFARGVSHRMRRVMLEFGNEDLLTIHAALKRTRRISLDDAMFAQLFMTIRGLHGVRAPSQLATTVNLRRRVRRLPQNLMGNVVGFAVQTVGPEDDAASVAAGVSAGIQQLASRRVDYHATARYVAEHSKWWQRPFHMPTAVDPFHGNLLVSSLVNYRYDEVTFEPGAPVVRFFGKAADTFWSSLVFEPPRERTEPTRRVVSLWLPVRIARKLDGEAGRRLVVEAARASAGASSTAPPAARTSGERGAMHAVDAVAPDRS